MRTFNEWLEAIRPGGMPAKRTLDAMNNPEKIYPGQQQSQPFQKGQRVMVKRSAGNIEQWVVSNIQGDNIVVDSPDGKLEKTFNTQQLQQLQQQLQGQGQRPGGMPAKRTLDAMNNPEKWTYNQQGQPGPAA